MACLRRILSVLLILGLALGTTAQAAQVGMMAGTQETAAAAMDGGMAGCEGCASGQETGKGMDMAGCHGGICIVLPGLLPDSPDSPSVAPGAFAAASPTVADGLSPPPDHRPPIPSSLA
ncbi:hypothetical protein FZ983_31675 [Azospirillum sp. B21]|uniref:hypothetical protein n=1 Tax=unclassified Azospirillum TaxID=2630922 RepID=UPI0011EFA954|nr:MULTISPECIES: hypothetical protein [unclassified Azospirillum]KAA0572507.1 hypothetical protein FZ983_31675 [Azospirillum sp. B21]MDR6775614.1 hypothetical protein [Azospirillum sp. BE72]